MEDFVTTEYNFLLQELLQNQSESVVGVESPVAVGNIPSSPPNLNGNNSAGGNGASGNNTTGIGFSYYND
jgi:hypothetical protein